MPSSSVRPYLILFVSTISAAVLKPLQSINGRLQTELDTNNGSEIIIPSNPSAGSNAIRAQCNAQKFGSGLNLASCRNALNNIVPDDTYSSFGQRHDGNRYNGILPYWWLSYDGRCSFELFIVAPSTIAHATISDVKAAAQALFDRCLTAAASAKGGVATQIGGDNRLAVVMKQHSFPNIRCVPAPGFVPSAPNRRKMLHACRAIESDMPATKATRVFGPEGSPGVAVDLPRGFSGDRDDYQCVVQVSDNGRSDSYSWYSIWEQVEALVNVCVQAGQIGIAEGLGPNGNIAVDLHYHTPDSNALEDNSTVLALGNSSIALTQDR